MNRRQFLKRGSLFVAATALLEPGELAEMLAPRRLYVRGAEFGAQQDLFKNHVEVKSSEILADLERRVQQRMESYYEQIADYVYGDLYEYPRALVPSGNVLIGGTDAFAVWRA